MDRVFQQPVKINAYASEVQYANKLWPIWQAIDPLLRGEFVVHPRLDGQYGAHPGSLDREGIWMVGSSHDTKITSGPYIYVEHGAGQTYQDSRWYCSTFRKNMVAALVPGPYCAALTQKFNPEALVIPIGAPHLRGLTPKTATSIMFAWHWRCSLAPEANTAFDEYEAVLPKVAEHWRVRGTGHPRILSEILPKYRSMNIEPAYKYEDALDATGILVADNSSLIYEAAALDIPVVVLNAKSYRKDHSWGLRFWDAIPGPQVDDPGDLIEVIHDQIVGGYLEWEEERRRVSSLVYGPDPLDGLENGVEQLEDMLSVAHYR